MFRLNDKMDHDPKANPRPLDRWVVIGFIALAMVPIAYVAVPIELAKWRVAQALNSYRLGDETQTGIYLDKAEKASADIRTNREFVLLKAQLIANAENDEEAIALLKSVAKKDDPESIRLGLGIANYFLSGGDFDRALEALEIASPMDRAQAVKKFKSGGQEATVLNLRAYLRSLANQELDQALLDIDAALSLEPNEPSLMDTKAWVLYRQGKFEEAAAWIGDGLDRMEKAFEARGLSIGEPPPSESGDPSETKNSNPSDEASKTPSSRLSGTQQSIAERLRQRNQEIAEEPNPRIRFQKAEELLGEFKSLAVLRYHRAKILDAKGDHDSASKDWRWLEHHGFQDESLLF